MRVTRIQFTSIAAIVAITLIGGRVVAQNAVPRGAALLADARKAIGGEDKLRAIKTLQANGSLRRTAGTNTIEGDVEVQIETPDKYRRNESIGFAGGPTVDRTEVLNGSETWEETSGGNFGGQRGGFGGGGRGGFGGGGGRGIFVGPGGRDARAGDQGAANAGGRGQIDPERLREAQRRMRQADFARLMLAWLLTTDAPVTWGGTAQAPDGTADVLEITPLQGDAMRLFLDQSSHLPLMITWQGPQVRFAQGRRGGGRRGDGQQPPPDQADPDMQRVPPQPATFAMHLGDYKAVGGVKLPFTMTRSINDQTLEQVTVKSYKINPSFKANTFTKPKA